ncbi:RNA polymerase sigma factor [Brevundimonas naejangsanensis]|jgi:RNA polymerase sigma factor (sigma-70 family)|uniref:RNA polymerase sigma factor n=1 Tax=Brevundimonas naejangsanensis TaxID=588932 RepID=UPI003D03343F
MKPNRSEPARASDPDVLAASGQIDAKLLRRYEGALRDFFGRRVYSRDEVDDLVQEAFARLIESGGRRDVEYPAAYLFRIASNLIHDRGRRRARSPVQAELDVEDAALAVAPEQENRRRLEDLQMTLNAVLDQLPAKCRDVFVMRRFKNMTTPEIAGALGISHRMVQKHMSRALLALHEAVSEQGRGREGSL